MLEDKYIGLCLALGSAFLTGASYIVTKKGLMSSKNGGMAQGHGYLSNSLWWAGMAIMAAGEIANFAAYSYAPAILVTPLGALSVLVSAVLATVFLDERLGRDGILGCGLSLIGSIIIILHAPTEQPLNSIDEMAKYAMSAGFITYSIFVIGTTLFLIFYAAPRYGRTNSLVYITICSLVGSITVMACKALGIALRLTLSSTNQFTHFSTYFFLFVTIGCIVVQMNYFNKALDIFSTNIVTPIYYVFFTTATIVASVILLQGIANTTAPDIITIFCAFITIFIGVFLLNAPRATAVHHGDSVLVGSRGGGKTLLSTFDSENLGFVGLDDTIDDV